MPAAFFHTFHTLVFLPLSVFGCVSLVAFLGALCLPPGCTLPVIWVAGSLLTALLYTCVCTALVWDRFFGGSAILTPSWLSPANLRPVPCATSGSSSSVASPVGRLLDPFSYHLFDRSRGLVLFQPFVPKTSLLWFSYILGTFPRLVSWVSGHGHHVYYHHPHGTFRLSETRHLTTTDCWKCCLYIYRRHFRQSVVKTPLHPFYLHLILYYLYIRLFYTHSLYTLFTLCINHYYHFVCILRLHPCAKRLCSFQSQFIVYHKQVYKCCNLSREAQLKACTRLGCMCAALQPSLWWVKNFLTPAVISTVSIP